MKLLIEVVKKRIEKNAKQVQKESLEKPHEPDKSIWECQRILTLDISDKLVEAMLMSSFGTSRGCSFWVVSQPLYENVHFHVICSPATTPVKVFFFTSSTGKVQ